jgi:L-asparaginase II
MEMPGSDRSNALRDASVPMASVMRGGEPDTVHLGIACLVDSRGDILWSLGDPGVRSFFRSCAKPLQALALLESGAADAAGLGDRDLAIICGSHAGGPEQTTLVEAILAKSRLAPTALGCGEGLADMCSGKHAGMLTACAHLGLPLESYLDADHPWQLRILARVCEYCRYDTAGMGPAMDGCSAPTQSLPLFNMAYGFARLAAEAASQGPAKRLLGAMAAHPGGDTGEPDLRIFSAEAGALVTKNGANGLLCAALPGLGLGFALKIADGASLPRWPVFIRALEQAGILSPSAARSMAASLCPPISTRRGENAGHIRLDF